MNFSNSSNFKQNHHRYARNVGYDKFGDYAGDEPLENAPLRGTSYILFVLFCLVLLIFTFLLFIFAPLIVFGATWAGATIPDLPVFDMDSLMTVLLGMLGLGGMRSFEKAKGLTK